MLNLQPAQNVKVNAVSQSPVQGAASTQPVADIVQALTESFSLGDTGGKQDDFQSFNASLADAASRQQPVERKKPIDKKENAAIERGRDDARPYQSNEVDRRDVRKPGADSRVNKESNDSSSDAQARDAGKVSEEKAVSANDNAAKGEIKQSDAKQVLEDVKEVIDQIDLALASGGEQMSAEMAAMLANMKAILQQLVQQLTQALNAGEVQGTEVVPLDMKALAPLLDQLSKIVDSLKDANSELAAALGIELGDEVLAADGDSADEAVDPNQVSAGKGPMQKLLAHLTGLSSQLEEVTGRLEKSLDISTKISPLGQVAVEAASAPTTTETVLAAARVSAEQDMRKASDKGVDAPLSQTQETAVQLPQNNANNTQVASTQAVVANTGGQASAQFGGSGQGQNQGQQNVAQVAGVSTASQAQNMGKDAPSFEQALRHPIKGNATEQVVFQMKSMVKDGNTKMIVRLDPPELGELEIKMQVNRQGKTDVVISVERVQTLDILQKDSRMLQQALNDAGLKTDGGSLSFNLKGENSGGQQRQGNNPYPVVKDAFDEDMLQVVSTTYTTDVEHGVNIRI